MSKNKKDSADKGKSKLRGWLIDALLIVAIFVGIQFWMQRGMAQGDAPDFKTILTGGQAVELSDYRGSPLLLHFWASWCPYCNFEQGSITDLAKDSQVLTVAFQSGDRTEVIAFMEKKGIQKWPVISDEDGKLAQSYGVSAVPSTFIIDGKGKIRFKTAGLTSKWGLQLRLWLVKVLY